MGQRVGYWPLLIKLIKQVHHCLLNCGVYELVGTRLSGNRESSLGSYQDVKFCMENNILSKGYKSPAQVEVLEVA